MKKKLLDNRKSGCLTRPKTAEHTESSLGPGFVQRFQKRAHTAPRLAMRGGWIPLVVAVFAGAALLGGCGKKAEPLPEATTTEQPVVMTTFYPTAYFAQRIVGESVNIAVINQAPAGADPASWNPSDEDITRYQLASLILLQGAGFEKWIATAALPRTRIVDTTAGLDQPFITHQTTSHSHGPAGDHTHAGIDAHTWLDPVIASAQASAVATALATRFPEYATEFAANAEAFASDLAALDERWQTLAPRLGQATLLAAHPTYNYPARRYGFTVANLDIDPNAVLSEDEINAVRSAAEAAPRDRTVRIMLWESEPRTDTVEQLERLCGVRSVVVRPAESLTPEAAKAGEDFLTIMHRNLDRLDAVLP